MPPEGSPLLLEFPNGFRENYRLEFAESGPQDAEPPALVFTKVEALASRSVLDCAGSPGGDIEEFIASIPVCIIAPEVATGRLVVRKLYFLCEAP